MRYLLAQLWDDDAGVVLTTEWVLLVIVLVLGVAIGFFAMRQAIMTNVLDMTNHSTGGAPGQGVAGQPDSELTEATSNKRSGFGDTIAVKSTAAVPGGIDNRLCD
jgi:hypothetical protein